MHRHGTGSICVGEELCVKETRRHGVGQTVSAQSRHRRPVCCACTSAGTNEQPFPTLLGQEAYLKNSGLEDMQVFGPSCLPGLCRQTSSQIHRRFGLGLESRNVWQLRAPVAEGIMNANHGLVRQCGDAIGSSSSCKVRAVSCQRFQSCRLVARLPAAVLVMLECAFRRRALSVAIGFSSPVAQTRPASQACLSHSAFVKPKHITSTSDSGLESTARTRMPSRDFQPWCALYPSSCQNSNSGSRCWGRPPAQGTMIRSQGVVTTSARPNLLKANIAVQSAALPGCRDVQSNPLPPPCRTDLISNSPGLLG